MHTIQGKDKMNSTEQTSPENKKTKKIKPKNIHTHTPKKETNNTHNILRVMELMVHWRNAEIPFFVCVCVSFSFIFVCVCVFVVPSFVVSFICPTWLFRGVCTTLSMI